MADVSKVPFSGLQVAISGYQESIIAQQMSTGDTVTLSSFGTIGNVLAFRNDSGATVTLTIAGNVLTLATSSIVKQNISIIAWGTHS